MYEAHFGITGPPFRLSPDPAFLFDGGQHRQALAVLRQAFSRGLPFVVLSGEIGAGKTTVLQAWLAECRSAGIAVAQIANTQLDAEALQGAIAANFGLEGPAPSALRRFFRELKGGRAALLVDEAQNLDRPALESLVQLAQVAAEEKAELRIVLAGQPELRAHVAALDALIQQSCHLGPLDVDQTRQYIEHRLRKVGWKGRPSFDAAAFEAIHALTGGVPRRINVLANRLLLGQFLNGTARIDQEGVNAIAQALDAEIGSGTVTVDPDRDKGAAVPAAIEPGSLWVIASGRSDYIKATALMRAADRQPGLPPTVAVGLSDSTPWHLNRDHHLYLGWTQRFVSLAERAPNSAEAGFERLIEQCRPRAVVVLDGDARSHRCAVVAVRHGVPVVQIGANAQTLDEHDDRKSPRAAISQLASLRFVDQVSDGANGSPQARPSHAVGNLLVDALSLAWEVAKWSVQAAGRRMAPMASSQHIDERRGYGVVALKQPPEHTGEPVRPGALALLREVSRDLPLVWPMRHGTMLLAHKSGLARTLEGDRIARIEELGYVNYLRLMRGATCVLTDSPDVMEEAAALGVPCLSLGLRHVIHVDAGGWMTATEVEGHARAATRAVWEILFRGASDAALPEDWDGGAGARIATQMALWLGSTREKASQPPVLRHALHTSPGDDGRHGT